MGLLDVLLGRTKQKRPNLDVLFAIPGAAYTMQAAMGLAPTGVGSVSYRSAEGPAARQARSDIDALMAADPASDVVGSRDEYDYTWITCHRTDDDLAALMTQLHAVNRTLADAGFGPALLCTAVGFSGDVDGNPRRLALVYLFQRGTVYPFAPTGRQGRDTALEMQVRAHLAGDIPIEPELGRWFPIWNAPVP